MVGTMVADGWLPEARKNAKWLIGLGIVQVIFGLLAIGCPLVTGIVVSVFVGAMLLVSGIGRIIQAFKANSWGVGMLALLIGALTVIAGVVMLFRPVVGLATLTLVLAFYFLFEGISTLVVAWRMRPAQGWGWVFFNGLVSLLLGILIWRQWPVSGAWAIGTIVGIHILFNGWSMIMIGALARRRGDAPAA